jgi:hypothetical protein
MDGDSGDEGDGGGPFEGYDARIRPGGGESGATLGTLAALRENTNPLPVALGAAGIAVLFGANAAGVLGHGAFAIAPVLAGVVTVAFLHDEPDRWLGTGAGIAAAGVVAGVGVGLPVAAVLGAPESEYLDAGAVGLLASPVILMGSAVVAVLLGNVYARLTDEDDGEGLPEPP